MTLVGKGGEGREDKGGEGREEKEGRRREGGEGREEKKDDQSQDKHSVHVVLAGPTNPRAACCSNSWGPWSP